MYISYSEYALRAPGAIFQFFFINIQYQAKKYNKKKINKTDKEMKFSAKIKIMQLKF